MFGRVHSTGSAAVASCGLGRLTGAQLFTAKRVAIGGSGSRPGLCAASMLIWGSTFAVAIFRWPGAGPMRQIQAAPSRIRNPSGGFDSG
jgi:hypothetical protein